MSGARACSWRLLLAITVLAVLASPVGGAAPSGAIAGWEWAYSAQASEAPPGGPWQPVELPGRFPRSAAGGYVWLRAVVGLDSPSGLLIGPLGFAERVWADGVLVGAAGSTGGRFRSPLGGVRAYPLPGGPQGQGAGPVEVRILVRLYDPGLSWLAAPPRLVPMERLERERLIRNLPVLAQGGAAAYLALLFLVYICLSAFRPARHWLVAALLCLAAALTLFAWSPLSWLAPLVWTLQLHSLFLLLAVSLWLAFAGDFLGLFRRPWALFPALAPALLGVAGLFFADLRPLVRWSFVQGAAAVLTLAAGAVIAAASIRARPAQGAVALGVFAAAAASLALSLVRPGVSPLVPGAGVGVGIAVYATWILGSMGASAESRRAQIGGELQRRIAADSAVVERLKDGRSRLENRNLESLILANRLVDSAQKQVQSISQIMSSIEEGATAEGGVMIKERQILSLTGEVDARIAEFNTQIAGALKELQDLQATSRTITEAVSQIIGIAEKTNMLSLNASIEATKAGEAGRGFGVVAQQVRKLADVTRNVSDQVGGLIRESNRAVEKNVHMAMEMAKGYREIMHQSEKIRQMLEENFQALQDVTQAHGRIQDGVAGLDQTIRTVLEVSRDLREMTGGLVGAFAWFNELISSGGGAQDESPAVAGLPAGPPAPVEELEAEAEQLAPDEQAAAATVARGEAGSPDDRGAPAPEESAGAEAGPEPGAVDEEAWAEELASVVPDEPLGGGLMGPAAFPDVDAELDELGGPDLEELGAAGGGTPGYGDELRGPEEDAAGRIPAGRRPGELEVLEESEELEEL